MSELTHRVSASEVVAAIRDASFDEVMHVIERYCDDPRVCVQKAITRARRAYEHECAERERVRALYALQHHAGGSGVVLGIDEVGRGSVAGPLTVCAVALPDEPILWGLDDSKRLTPAAREELSRRIRACARAIGLVHIEPATIDKVGMATALRLGMIGALENTGLEPDAVLIDGNPVHVHPREKSFVGGDRRIACIAAASIVAKVTRDALMCRLDEEYPGYHLAASKGYASAKHIEAIRAKGLSPIHRASFCGNFLDTLRLF